MDADEYITSISARFGAILDYLKIKTNKQKVIECGGSGGSKNTWNLLKPGDKIIAFGGGINGHLHNLYVYSSAVWLLGIYKLIWNFITLKYFQLIKILKRLNMSRVCWVSFLKNIYNIIYFNAMHKINLSTYHYIYHIYYIKFY